MLLLKFVRGMFEVRGYTEIEEFPPTPDNIVMRAKMGVEPTSPPILVFYDGEVKLSTKSVRNVVITMKAKGVKHCIVINDEVTSKARQISNEILDCHMEFFERNEFLYNPCDNHLVPRHDLYLQCSDPKAAKFRAKYKMPILLLTDPITRFYGFQAGDIIKVSRPDGIAFRIVK